MSSDYPPLFDQLFAEDPQFREAGRVNYETFAGRLGYRIGGQNMPPWSKVDANEKLAWATAAYEVLQKCWKESAPQARHRRNR